MIIYIGADHRGFKLKEYLKDSLKGKGYEMVDLGNDHYEEGDDYPDFAEKVARKISLNYEKALGIVICSSGVGVDVVANKFMRVRSVLAATSDQAYDSRNDDNTNVLALGADYLKPEEAKNIAVTWLETPFAGEEKFKRRLEKISKIESKVSHPVGEEEE
ncbi:MAG: RpiB/LacA/LacB family sugar-phosphate isomerase [Patescibacteria group bacterium]|nr:RpiB/LacA/LacB family sugar-phosphate isomerase [Patescibacteria group bacterium]